MKTTLDILQILLVVLMLSPNALIAQDLPAPAGPPAEGGADAAAGDPVTEGAGGVEAAGQSGDKIDLSVSEAPIKDVLRMMGEMRENVNIFVDPDVTGTITFQLQGMEWQKALELITESQGLVVTEEGENIYRVSKVKEQVMADIVIELYDRAGVEALDDDTVMALVAEPTLLVEQAWNRVLSHPNNYIKLLSVDQQPAVDVVSALARKADLNFAFSTRARPSASAAQPTGQQAAPEQPRRIDAEDLPPISLNLRNISVENALELIATQGGLSVDYKNGVWSVTPMTPDELRQEPLRLETFQVQFIPLDDELLGIVKGLITERGMVSLGKNKILIVRDTSDGIDAVRQTLEIMDTPTPQVIIEARFFELQKGSSKDLGVDWNALGPDGVAVNIDPLTWDYAKAISRGDLDDSSVSRSNTETRSRDLATGVLTGSADESESADRTSQDIRDKTVDTVRSAVLDVSQFGVILHALKDNTGAKQLSNPKIVVSSDQQATIHIGEQTPIVQSSLETTSAGNAVRTFELDPSYGGETTAGEQLLPESKARPYKTRKGYLDLGTKLTVAPSVKTADQVYIRVVPELTSLVGFETFGSGDSLTRYPSLFNTRVHTEFTIRSGQTIAIGGLVSERETNSRNEVPLLGKLPGLGRLFSYDTSSKSQTETIIFLTVKVVSAEELIATTGVPIRAYLVQPELDRIAEEDAAGAGYSEERARLILEATEEREDETGDAEETSIIEQPVAPFVPADTDAAPGVTAEDDEQARLEAVPDASAASEPADQAAPAQDTGGAAEFYEPEQAR